MEKEVTEGIAEDGEVMEGNVRKKRRCRLSNEKVNSLTKCVIYSTLQEQLPHIYVMK